MVLKRTNFDIVFANDIKAQAKRAWSKYFKKYGISPDVYKVASIVDLVKQHKQNKNIFPNNIDIVTGGFPCQDFSVGALNKLSKGLKGKKGVLWYEIKRILSYNVRNKYLSKLLEKYGKNTDEIWSSITTNQGSVSHLDFLTKKQKEVFKTAFEIDQNWIIELGADRTPNISQAQSINIFVPADVHKRELHQIHFQAWKKGLKSLYYCRSKSIQRAENINSGSSTDVVKNVYSEKKESENDNDKYEECLSCQ